MTHAHLTPYLGFREGARRVPLIDRVEVIIGVLLKTAVLRCDS